MNVRSIRHRALRRFYEEDETKGLVAGSVDKPRDVLSALDRAKSVEDLKAFPFWKAHPLSGDRKGTWSLHVTRNWRLTFRVEDNVICDMKLEDYH